MKLPDTLTPEQSAAIVACLRILARRGEEVLRERAQRDVMTASNNERAATMTGGERNTATKYGNQENHTTTNG
jgi:predicted DNA-binding transcriptional regulator YafY